MQCNVSVLEKCKEKLKNDLKDTLSVWCDDVSKTYKPMNDNFDVFYSKMKIMSEDSNKFVLNIKKIYEDKYSIYEDMIMYFKRLVEDA